MASETQVLIFETKGEHLRGNPDTEYKQKVLKTLEGAFSAAGTIMLREGPGRTNIFQLVFSENQFPEISAQLEENDNE